LTELDVIAAIRAGDVARVTSLIGENPALVNAHAKSGESAVLLATYHGNRALADLLIAHGATLSFHEAAATGRLELVQQYLKDEPDLIDTFSPDGFTALGLAAFFGHAALVDILLANGAKVNISSRNPLNVMPLHSSVASRQYGITKALLDHGADVNAKQQEDYTPLHEAAQNGDLETVALLLARGANIEARNTNGSTPLETALKAGHAHIAELLEKHGK
jgi:ankyrin repeat protein